MFNLQMIQYRCESGLVGPVSSRTNKPKKKKKKKLKGEKVEDTNKIEHNVYKLLDLMNQIQRK